MIDQTISHYKIIEKLGSGGMGDVYKAEDTKLKRIVALKFLPTALTRDKEARQRFIHEARTASALDHPNIGTIYEIDEHDGSYFIAMAYYEGETLKEKIDRGPLDIAEALDIESRILKGLEKAHSKNIIHRDIKPSNILITKEGEVKIIDFGLAKLKGNTILTKKSTTMGSISYMSPEQTEGGTVDYRTDIWSAGVVLYEMLAGERPFKADYEQAIMYQILNEQPEFITKIRGDVPQEVQQILEKALAKKPEKRFLAIEEMLAELKTTTEEFKEGLTTKSFGYKLGRKQRKRFYRTFGAVLIAIILGIYLWQNKVAEAAPIPIVLLPLESITTDDEQEWFTDGMTDALITDLAKIRGLQVISQSSAMQYKGTSKAVTEIAAELGVEYIIEGSIAKMGDKVKISTRLINAADDVYLWAEEYEREFRNILGLQGEIAQSIAGQIQIELTPQEETQLATTRSVNPETYELYLKGMYHLNKYTPDGFTKGFSYLHQAVESDPDEPLAHASLAIAYDMIAHTPSPPPDALSNARNFATKALELDDNLAEAHFALAMIQLFADWDNTGAEKSFKRALELKPSLAMAHSYYAFFVLIFGDENKALAEMNRAQELDPLAPLYPAWQGWLYFWMERNDEAIEEALKSLELVPNFPIGLYVLGCAYAAKGMYDEAITAHQKAGTIGPEWKWALGQTYALAGRVDEAIEVAAELESQPKVWDTWGIAEIYAALDEKDKAFHWLEEAFKQRHPYIQWIKKNPSLKSLFDDSRFYDLAQRLNLPD
ncbi:MAG: protein kinase [Bacteroidota bacterium]